MDIKEPVITQDQIIILKDDNFTPDTVCIVTGAGSGIGRATAIAAAANHLTVVGLDYNEQTGQETQRLCEGLGGRMVFIPCDLTEDVQMDRAVAEAAKLGQVRYLANIAGIQHVDPIEDFPVKTFDLMQRLMVRAPFYLSGKVIPLMRQAGSGAVGNMASIHAHICTLNKSSYNIAKFALRGLAKSISAEGQGKIRGFTISTGFVKTALALGQIPSQARQRGITEEEVVTDVMMGSSRVKEMMSPVEVGNLFVLGFSRFSRYLLGGDLLFDGGIVSTY
ncbi:SDR family NAD(P)-dependent oxidoreductase [Desulfosarcina sp.]|uniref:SDR family NAD(P)-dependent oxidoreductase n=1 Tax=Desulfosarcina sp. TaxID=2027861 RepID=UPI0029BE84AB|nr:SDR family NAD(P)-dependent oxidoreductase [Desulfosarcina sp.]MDX2454688.1 SDR family oxidoreductase [Desulfosarcina sp.]